VTAARDSPEWRALQDHFDRIGDVHLRDLFIADPARGERMALEVGDLYLDYSKNRLTDETLGLLVALAERAGLRQRIDEMFAGRRINRTEDRAVLHVALRAPADRRIEVDGDDVVSDVHAVLDRMAAFAERVRSGGWTGFTGRPQVGPADADVDHVGDGPAMAYRALKDYSDRSRTFRFVSNVDGADFWENTADLDPAETLFVVSSKTFTTIETLTNARTARSSVRLIRRPANISSIRCRSPARSARATSRPRVSPVRRFLE